MQLTYGEVDSYQVICLVNSQESCNSTNQLFTLSEQNRKNPALAIKRLNEFSQGKASENTENESKKSPQFVSLEALVNASFTASEGS